MNFLKSYKLPLLSGTLYGVSWPIFEWLNFSFLAWFAFVPLFVFLEQNKASFWRSMLGSYLAMFVFGCFSAGWLFNFPQSKLAVLTIFLLEEVWFFMPFLFFFPIQRKLGFDKALWLFPFIWMLWEFIYLQLEFTMGTHLSAYSQSSNLWLIQHIDLTGMWGVSLWLIFFNVLIFKAYQKVKYSLREKSFYKKLLPIFGWMLGIPLLYSAFAFANYGELDSIKSLKVALIPTQFSADFLNDSQKGIEIVERTLHRTDSLAFNLMESGNGADLYLWPETGISYRMGVSNLTDLLFEATQDWEGALLTGCKGVPSTAIDTTDRRLHVSGVLISHKSEVTKYHHKTALTPGQERIPYHHWLAKLPFFPIEETDWSYFKVGTKSEPLPLTTKEGKQFNVGVSLCFEQWYPNHWAELARNGAELYAHLAGEGWYGDVGFQQFMANVSRMRSIENRKQTARCANVGKSLFIDQMGRFRRKSKLGSLETSTYELKASQITTLFAKSPNWFPILCFVFLVGLGIIQYPRSGR